MTRLKRASHWSPKQCLTSSVLVLFLRVEPACVTAPTPQGLIRVSSVSSVHCGLTVFAAAASELEGVSCSPQTVPPWVTDSIKVESGKNIPL